MASSEAGVPATMRAVVTMKRGPAAEALVLHTDWPVPARKPNQVLIKAAATSVNAGDWKMRSGFVAIPMKTPRIQGEDVSGIVVAAPEGSKFKPGDRVMAETGQGLKSGELGGTYGEYVATDEDTVWPIPPGWGFLEAACVPEAGITAWQALEPDMPLAGKRVLVHGGAGGIGGFATQIAKAQGAHVTTTCSTRNVELVTKEFGADVAIDYTKGPWQDTPEATAEGGFDVVLDTVGGPYLKQSLKRLRHGGRYVSLGATGPGVDHVGMLSLVGYLAGWMGRTLMGKLKLGPRFTLVMTECKAERGLRQLAELMQEGKLKVHLDKVFPLEEMAAAHDYGAEGHTRGKVAVEIAKL